MATKQLMNHPLVLPLSELMAFSRAFDCGIGKQEVLHSSKAASSPLKNPPSVGKWDRFVNIICFLIVKLLFF